MESTPYSSDSILGSSFNNTSYASHQILHAQKYAQASDASLVVFYNLFIPYGDGVTNAINVIKDQISQVSYALYNLEQVHNNNFEKEKSKGMQVIGDSFRGAGRKYPWLEVNSSQMSGKLVQYPSREDIPENINEQLIVELYSK